MFQSEVNENGEGFESQKALSRKLDSVLLDVVALLSVPEGHIDKINFLKDKGLSIKENEDCKSYRVKTPDGSNFELSTLAKIDKKGFRARSVAVHGVDEGGKINPKPLSVRIAFGGTSTLFDAPRTLAMAITKRPLQNKKMIDKLIVKTSEEYKKLYSSDILPEKVVVSAHSAGATHAIHTYEKLNELGINAKLRLYEPYGAKFTGKSADDDKHKDTVSYRAQNSFLKYFGLDGRTIGYTEVLPSFKNNRQCNGAGIFGSIKSHMLICVASYVIESERSKIPLDISIANLNNSNISSSFLPRR